MKTKQRCLLGIFIALLFLMGCGESEKEIEQGTFIYYLNMEGTGLVKEEYIFSDEKIEQSIERILADLQNVESEDYVSVFPADVEVKDWTYKNGKLRLDFHKSYKEMDTASELLLRAALVQTFTQLESVGYVEIYVDGQPLTDKKGNEIGPMAADYFVQNTGSSLHSTQAASVKLYFANTDGDKLEEEIREVHYNSNMSIEKMIIEELMDGPESGKGQPTLSKQCTVLGVSIKDEICYINFDETFLDAIYPFDPKLTIYSLVNSIVENGNANQVQILVNGETDVKYYESIDLSQPFSRNLDIVEKEKE